MTSKVSQMSQDKWDQLQHCKEQWQCPGPDINSDQVNLLSQSKRSVQAPGIDDGADAASAREAL